MKFFSIFSFNIMGFGYFEDVEIDVNNDFKIFIIFKGKNLCIYR